MVDVGVVVAVVVGVVISHLENTPAEESLSMLFQMGTNVSQSTVGTIYP